MKHSILNFCTIILFLSTIRFFAQQSTLRLQREARSLLREGNQLYSKERFNEASIAYRKALGKDYKYDKANHNFGNALYQNKNYKEAVSQYESITKTAASKVEKAEAFHNIGNAMMRQKQYKQAVEAYKNALRNNPNDDETRYNLAVAQKQVKNQKNQSKNDKNKNQKNEDQKNNKNQNKKEEDNEDKKNKDENKQQQPKPKPGKMTPEQMKQLLESLNNEEKKTQKKMNVKKSKGRKIKQEKDW